MKCVQRKWNICDLKGQYSVTSVNNSYGPPYSMFKACLKGLKDQFNNTWFFFSLCGGWPPPVLGLRNDHRALYSVLLSLLHSPLILGRCSNGSYKPIFDSSQPAGAYITKSKPGVWRDLEKEKKASIIIMLPCEFELLPCTTKEIELLVSINSSSSSLPILSTSCVRQAC